MTPALSQATGTLARPAHLAPGPIAAALNHARAIPQAEKYFCPADYGEKIILTFGYPGGSRLAVSIDTAGCLFATNGDRTVRTPPATLTQLEVVLGHDNR